ncbi:HdeD family acid-resistance protein [Frankia sp. Cj5]|uniref:HdeD family acid-resistance protein n=1 Tax=Frankia sp. Cj5 TaxID=2880978 RepID=UPI001EF5DBE8|nr:DUF308 domain-containing protein [Frankia sp. Cj5]
MSAATAPAHRDGERAGAVSWWFVLAVGIAWSLFALAILQFELTTERSIAVLLGVVLFVSVASELLATTATARGWRWSHALLAVLFAAGGVVALVWPDPTFAVVARIVAWYLLGKGIFDVVNAFVARRAELRGADFRHSDLRAADSPGAEVADLRGAAQWWMPLIVGMFEIGVAFWAVGYPKSSLTLLVLWVALAALATGLTKICMAARMRGARRDLATVDMFLSTGFGVPAVTEATRTHARTEATAGEGHGQRRFT